MNHLYPYRSGSRIFVIGSKITISRGRGGGGGGGGGVDGGFPCHLSIITYDIRNGNVALSNLRIEGTANRGL